MIYLDSSALVKRYVREKGTDIIHSPTTREEIIATSKLAYPEILSALMRKRRGGELEEGPLKIIINRFDADWTELFIIEVHDELLPLAKSLIRKYPLKGADSIHLASAMWLAGTARNDLTFVASDVNLLNAPMQENLQTLNPQ